MYLEKRVFVGISTLLQALCLGGGTGRGGRKEITCNITSFQKYFSHIRTIKVKVSHSQIAVGAVGVRVPLYLGHS